MNEKSYEPKNFMYLIDLLNLFRTFSNSIIRSRTSETRTARHGFVFVTSIAISCYTYDNNNCYIGPVFYILRITVEPWWLMIINHYETRYSNSIYCTVLYPPGVSSFPVSRGSQDNGDGKKMT